MSARAAGLQDAPTAADGVARAFDALALAALFSAVALAPWTARFALLLPALQALALVALTGRLMAVAVGSRSPLPPWRLLLPLGLYLAAITAAALGAAYQFGAWLAYLQLLAGPAAFLVAASLAGAPRPRRALAAAALLAALAALGYAGLQAFTDLVPPAPEGRLAGLWDNPNHFAGFLDLAVPLALAGTLFARRPASRLLFAPLFLALATAAGLTFSRGGWLALALAGAVLLFGWLAEAPRGRRLGRLAVAALLVAAALAAGLLLLERSPRLRGDLGQRLERFLGEQAASTLEVRLALSGTAMRMVLDHPWQGVGPGQFTDAISRYRPAAITGGPDEKLHQAVQHSLNDYVQSGANGGLPAMAGFVAFWLVALLSVPSRLPPAERWGARAALLAIMAHGLVDGNLSFVAGNALLAFALAGWAHAPYRRSSQT